MVAFNPENLKGKPISEVAEQAESAFQEGMTSLATASTIYGVLLKQRLNPYRRGFFRQMQWRADQRLGKHPLFYSQSGQDFFLYDRFFKDRRNGRFVEIGGYNGWSGSNCYFFEKIMNWRGVIVEASPSLIERIRTVRSSEVVHAAISDRDGEAQFIEVMSGYTQMGGLAEHYSDEKISQVRADPRHKERKITVPSLRLETLLQRYGLDQVDYCSIDVEGAERSVLGDFDFSAFDISVFSIENNSQGPQGSLRDILEPAGYVIVEVIGVDEIWVKRSLAERGAE